MTIEVLFFSRLRDLAGGARRELQLPEGATVGDALARLHAEHPGMAPWDKHLLLAVGLEYVGREQTLREGDSLSVMPPVQGG
ncbi:MAG: MoaD/ThiS family protein [Caulobacteraceae bacterium]|nr:MoaD/ThiS family protein [Caulobacter sp.]